MNVLNRNFTGESLKRISAECIDQPHDAAIGGEQDGLAMGTEFQASPFTLLLLRQLERDERPLVKRTQVVP